MLNASFDFDLSRSSRLGRLLRFVPTTRPFLEAYDRIERTYAAFVLHRFDRFSRGAGNWRKLKPETIKRKGSSAILVDTRAMRLGLGATGGIKIRVSGGSGGVSVELRFAQRDRHPNADLSISDLAAIHDGGLGKVPRRRILVGPDQTSRSDMLTAMRAACARTLSE